MTEKAESPAAEAEAEAKQFDAKITKLADQIVALTLIEAKTLADCLKEVHGIEPAAAAAVAIAAPGAEAAEAEEKTSFDVVLKEIGDKKIQVIKAVRAMTSLGLKEAKEMVESAPKAVKEGVSKEEADEAFKQLSEAGAIVEIA